MSNPLVAPRVDSTTAVSGIGLLESAVDLQQGIASGSWVEGGLGLAGAGLETLGLVIDPLGTLAGYAVGWLIEHVQPLSDALDALAGDPDAIAAYAATWGNVNGAVVAAADDLERGIAGTTEVWTGQAADAYRAQATDRVAALRASAEQATSVGAAVSLVGTLVGVVREIVRDLVADCIATLLVRLPQWIAEIGASLGIATPHVVASAVALISKWVARISEVLLKLTRSISNLVPLLHNLRGLWDELADGFRKVPAVSGPAAKTPSAGAVPRSATLDAPGGPPAGTSSASAPATGGVPSPPTSRAVLLRPRRALRRRQTRWWRRHQRCPVLLPAPPRPRRRSRTPSPVSPPPRTCRPATPPTSARTGTPSRPATSTTPTTTSSTTPSWTGCATARSRRSTHSSRGWTRDCRPPTRWCGR